MSFAGLNTFISGALTTWELSIYAMYEGECWDLLLDLDAEPQRVACCGYICTICEPEVREFFPDRQALWTDHLFEPLLA